MVGSRAWNPDFPVPINYKIFEFTETKNGVRLKSMGDFGPPTQKLMWFPQSITQTNEKLVLFPKFSTPFYRFSKDSDHWELFEEQFEEGFSIDVEEFGKNLYSNRSSFYFPFNLTHEMEALWVFQV